MKYFYMIHTTVEEKEVFFLMHYFDRLRNEKYWKLKKERFKPFSPSEFKKGIDFVKRPGSVDHAPSCLTPPRGF